MSLARATLLERSVRLRTAVASDSVISKPPSEIEWNENARLVKGAACVSAFTALEDFIQSRIREVVSLLLGYPPASKGLPPPLKVALVMGAFESLVTRIKDQKRFGISDPVSLIVQNAARIASVNSAGMNPSDLALATNASNVSWKIIEDALTAFSVENPLSVMSGVASKIEGGIFAAKDHFELMLEWRHRISHVPDAEIPLSEVVNFANKLVLFCAAFDLALSTGASQVLAAKMSSAPPVTKLATLKLRIVEFHGNRWRELPHGKGRASSVHADANLAMFAAEATGKLAGECVVRREGNKSTPTASWSTPFL